MPRPRLLRPVVPVLPVLPVAEPFREPVQLVLGLDLRPVLLHGGAPEPGRKARLAA